MAARTRDAATLALMLSQVGDHDRALQYLEQYAAAAALTGVPKQELDQRIAELEAKAKQR